MSVDNAIFPVPIEIERVASSAAFCCGHIAEKGTVIFRSYYKGEVCFNSDSPFEEEVGKKFHMPGLKRLTVKDDAAGTGGEKPYEFSFKPNGTPSETLDLRLVVKKNFHQKPEPKSVAFGFFKENGSWKSNLWLAYSTSVPKKAKTNLETYQQVRIVGEEFVGQSVAFRKKEDGQWADKTIDVGQRESTINLHSCKFFGFQICHVKDLIISREDESPSRKNELPGQNGGTEHVVITLDGVGDGDGTEYADWLE